MKKDLKVIAVVVAIPLAICGVFGLGYLSAQPTHYGVIGSSAAETRVVELNALKVEDGINQKRAELGLPLLAHNESLKTSACLKLDNMVKLDYWGHVAPDGTEPWEFLNQADYAYENAGENLAYGYNSEADMIDHWMDSPSHRENITKSFAEQGVCTKVAKFQGQMTNVTVHHFGTPH